MTELYFKNLEKWLEIDEKYGISMEGYIKDVRDINSISSTKSKTILIDSNKETNKLFGSAFNLNVQNQQFDTTVKQEVELWHNNNRIATGYIQLINILHKGKYDYTYELQLFDDQINFFIEINENLITGNDDSSKDLDFSQWDHEWTVTNIVDSWSKTSDDIPYFYPMFSYSEAYWASVDVFNIAFYVKNIFDSIFRKYGYRYKSDFLESDYFKSLIIPYSQDQDFPQTDQTELDRRKWTAECDGCINYIRNWDGSLVDMSSVGYNLGNTYRVYALGGGLNTDANTVIESTFLPFNNQLTGEAQLFYDQALCNINITNFTDMPRIVPDRWGRDTYSFKCPFRIYYENNSGSDAYLVDASIWADSRVGFTIELVKIVADDTINPFGPQTQNWNNKSWNPDNPKLQVVAGTRQRVKINNKYFGDIVNGANTTIEGEIEVTFPEIGVSPTDIGYFVRVVPEPRRWKDSPGVVGTDLLIKGEYSFGDLGIAGTNNIMYNTPSSVNVSEGVTLNINNFLPPKFKQKDLIQSLNTMFNLCWREDKNEDKLIHIEPRDDFYKNGKIINLNNNDNFYIIDKDVKDTLVSDYQYKEHYFTYDNDTGDSTKFEDLGKSTAKEYTEKYKRIYGDQRVVFNNDNLNGVKEYKVKFASTICADIPHTTSNWITSFTTAPRTFVTSLIDTIAPKNKIRILFKNVLENNDTYITNTGSSGQTAKPIKEFIDSSGNPINPNNNVQPSLWGTATHFYPNAVNPKYSLNFGIPEKYYFTPKNIVESNLFNTFWVNTIRSLETDRIITAKFYIANSIFSSLELNSILYLDVNEYSGYFIINKINEYNVLTGEAKLELLTYDMNIDFQRRPITYLPGEGVFNPVKDTIKNPGTINVGTNNNIGNVGIAIGSDINIVETGVVMGDNSYADNSIVMGDNSFGSNNSIVMGDNSSGSSGSIVMGDNIDAEVPGVYGDNWSVGEDGLVIDGVTVVDSSGTVVAGTPIIDITYDDLVTVKLSSSLLRGSYYHITDRRIYLLAIENNKLSDYGLKIERGVKEVYYTPFIKTGDNYTGIYGQGISATTYPVSGTGGYDYYAIWGGRMWKRKTTGSDATPPDPITLDINGWDVIPTSDTTYYQDVELKIKYDFDNDNIKEVADKLGNIYWTEFSNDLNDLRNDWLNSEIFNNKINSVYIGITTYGIINNYQNSTVKAYIFNNSNNSIFNNSNNGAIWNNSNDSDIRNNSNNGSISNNYNGGSIFNNSNNGAIYYNYNNGFIGLNSNSGQISYNSNGGNINNNSNIGDISINSNNGEIETNSNSDDIYNNSNKGRIRINSNSGSITNNSNYGIIQNNISNVTYIDNNYNIGSIANNSNSGYISNNSNNGYISSNSNNGYISNNSNSDMISSNSNNGYISFNSNSGSISNNSNYGIIQYNSNNGQISQNKSTGIVNNNHIQYNINNNYIQYNDFTVSGVQIRYNTNNGYIGASSSPHITRTTNVTDIIVNK